MTTETRLRDRRAYDYQICVGLDALTKTIHHINRHRYQLVAVSQSGDAYTVFFLGEP